MKRYIVWIALFSIGVCCSAAAETYVTWNTLEPDKCASAWLMKRFIDREAVFKFVPAGDLIEEGVPFDTPDSEIRRYHNLSAYEYLLKKHELEDPALEEIGRIIHDIEINYWGEPVHSESDNVREDLKEFFEEDEEGARERFEGALEYFDGLYKKLKKK